MAFKMSKYLKIILIFLLLTQATSCLTQKLWSNSYDEPVQKFLVSRDGRYIVFLGANYHYMFTDKTGAMKELLGWPGRNLLFIDTESTNLKVDSRNNISGYASIESFFSNLRGDQRVFLKSLGFRNKNNSLALKLELKGKRYLPRQDLGRFLPALSRKYVFDIQYTPKASKAVAIAALTPITIVADSVLLFGKIVLLPFGD